MKVKFLVVLLLGCVGCNIKASEEDNLFLLSEVACDFSQLPPLIPLNALSERERLELVSMRIQSR